MRLLEEDPDLAGLMSGSRRAEAERELVVRVHRLGVGVWDVSRLEGAGADHVGLLLLEGVVAREVVVADHVSAELLGPGDLLRPWQAPSNSSLLPVDVLWSVLSPSAFAVLDRRFAAELARWPEVTAALFDRLSERSLRLATTQAISQLTRVDRRLKALLWHLAERWGRVSGDGVIVPLALTHRILGQLVGARRPMPPRSAAAARWPAAPATSCGRCAASARSATTTTCSSTTTSRAPAARSSRGAGVGAPSRE